MMHLPKQPRAARPGKHPRRDSISADEAEVNPFALHVMRKAIRAVGFDLGETLLFYRDTPLSWAAMYPEALAAVVSACNAIPTSEQIAAAKQILTQHNTRIVPRTHEIPASQIFLRF